MSPAARHRAARRERVIADLRAHLRSHPPTGAVRVILFGSLARGDFDAASDADLLLVGRSRLDDGIHRAAGRDVDVVTWGEDEWGRAVSEGHPLAREIARDGVELWRAPERGPA